MVRRTYLVVLVPLALLTVAVSGQPQPDLATIGPAVGARVPEFSGVDQFGRTQTLQSVAGPRGVMLVFFRSADW